MPTDKLHVTETNTTPNTTNTTHRVLACKSLLEEVTCQLLLGYMESCQLVSSITITITHTTIKLSTTIKLRVIKGKPSQLTDFCNLSLPRYLISSSHKSRNACPSTSCSKEVVQRKWYRFVNCH